VNQRDRAGSAIETVITDGPGAWKCIDVKGNVRIARCGVPLLGMSFKRTSRWLAMVSEGLRRWPFLQHNSVKQKG